MKYLILLVSICLFSCLNDGNNKSDVESYKIDLKGGSNAPTLFSDKFELKEYIKLETDSVAPISYILSLVISDHRVFISDVSNHIYFFDRDGKKINILSKGRGDKEFLDVADIQFDEVNNELYVCSRIQNKMFIYDGDGNYKREWSLPIHVNNFFLINSEEIICCTNFKGNKASESVEKNSYDQIFVLHKNGDEWDIVYRGFPFNKKHNDYITSVFMTSPFLQFNNGLYLMFPFETNLYKFDSKQLTFNKILNLDFGKYNIPDDFLSNVDSPGILETLREEHLILGWGNCYMDSKHFCFSTNFEEVKKTIIYNKRTKEVSISNNIVDIKNELPLEIISSRNRDNFLIACSNPQDLYESSPEKPNSLGTKLMQEVDEFDNPILLLYESK